MATWHRRDGSHSVAAWLQNKISQAWRSGHSLERERESQPSLAAVTSRNKRRFKGLRLKSLRFVHMAPKYAQGRWFTYKIHL